MEFKNILKDILMYGNYTQKELALLIGVKQSQISEWLKGKAKPGYDSLRAMVMYIPGITADYLLGLTD
jgi:DNA-binding helix-turn-helix protein